MAVDSARAKSLFLNAAELADQAERAAYLERECSGDAELRRRVEALLAADDGGGAVPEGDATRLPEQTSPATLEATAAVNAETRPPSELATADDRTDAADSTVAGGPRGARRGDSGLGHVIAGQYSLLELLGEGGMGTVYRAGQTKPVKRQVALKLIKIGMYSRSVLARFDAERQALALMDHPNIAQVFDGGTTEAGQPFFVMELVDGEPITEYCDRKRLPVKSRLELFVTVCQAVQHAHQKGIIHRDLKPSNVMVTEVDGRPTPKVIDFGVAKATEFSLTDQSLGDTEAIVGTPTYMSPEQADPSSTDIDTRTDVYALGVILYELLVGSPPLDARDFKRGAILEMVRMLREVDPPSPSTKLNTAEALPSIAASRSVEPTHLKRALQGDVDWVVMKALEKDRGRRYESANGFAADILRHLSHEPVEAAPPSRAYRLRKFVRKHRGAVVAASLVLLSLLGGLTAVVAVQTVANARLAVANDELVKSRADVQARFDLAMEAIKLFHGQVGDDLVLKADQFKPLRDRLLKGAADFYNKLEGLLKGQPDRASRQAMGKAYAELGGLTATIGDKTTALAAFRKSLAIRRELANGRDADVDTRHDVANSAFSTAVLLSETGNSTDALAHLEEARQLLEGLPPSGPGSVARRSLLGRVYATMSNVLADAGKTADARLAEQQALAITRKLADENPANAAFLSSLAGTTHNVALRMQAEGRTAEALAMYERARLTSEEAVRIDGTVPRYHTFLADHHSNIGELQWSAGNSAAAIESFRKALAIRQRLADENPAITDFRARLAHLHNSIGWRQMLAGKPNDAMESYRSALRIYRKLADENPRANGFQVGLGHTHHIIGMLQSDTGKTYEALESYERTLAIYQKLSDDSPDVLSYRYALAACQTNMANLLRKAGKRDEARAACDRALALQEPLVRDHPQVTAYRVDLAETYLRSGQVHVDFGDLTGASAAWKQALALFDGLNSTDDGTFFRSCCHAGLAGLAAQPGSGVSIEEGRAESDRAMCWLRRAVALGHVNPDACRTESALDPLRGRPDFRLMMMDLAFPADPFEKATDERQLLSVA